MEDPILAWLRQAAEHAEELEAVLLKGYRIEHGATSAVESLARSCA